MTTAGEKKMTCETTERLFVWKVTGHGNVVKHKKYGDQFTTFKTLKVVAANKQEAIEFATPNLGENTLAIEVVEYCKLSRDADAVKGVQG